MSLKESFDKTKRTLTQEAYNLDPGKYPISLEGTREEQIRAAKALDVLMQSAMGRELVEQAGRIGYKVHITPLEGAGGFCVPRTKTVQVNSNARPERDILVLAHELRHAWQNNNHLFSNYAVDDLKAIHIKNRAMEADANAVSALVVHQLKVKGYTKVFEDSAKSDSCVRNFSDAFNKTKSEEKAMQAAFTGWYKNESTKDFYDKYYFVDGWGKHTDYNLKGMSFSRSLDSADYMRKISSIGGKSYMSGQDPLLLEKEPCYDISKKAKKALEQYFARYEQVTGKVVDKSCLDIPVRGGVATKALKMQQVKKRGLVGDFGYSSVKDTLNSMGNSLNSVAGRANDSLNRASDKVEKNLVRLTGKTAASLRGLGSKAVSSLDAVAERAIKRVSDGAAAFVEAGKDILRAPSLVKAWNSTARGIKKFLKMPLEYDAGGVKFYSTDFNVDKVRNTVSRLAKSEDGKKLLESAHKDKIKINSERNGFSMPLGMFSIAQKEVTLNTSFSEAKAVSTLAHELRHGQQKADWSKDGSPAVCVAVSNTQEADAQVTALKCAWQLGLDGDVEPFNEFSAKYPEMTKAFTDSQKKGHSLNKSLTSAFDAWFKDEPRKERYDAETLKMYNSMDEFNRLDYKSSSPTMKDIVDHYCGCDGSNYFVGNYNKPDYMKVSSRLLEAFEKTQGADKEQPLKKQAGLNKLRQNSLKSYNGSIQDILIKQQQYLEL
ncbi:MAG: DUF6782 family putative metallopeptidase [Alphaproteobacteria bacterium]